jgi:hypothetical protein
MGFSSEEVGVCWLPPTIDCTIARASKWGPALMGAGMMADRADVIFAAPGEISGLIADQC